MTMPANPAPEAYEPSYPRIVLMATDNISEDKAPISWGVGDRHPFMSQMRIVAMYLHDGVVEIYSFDGIKTGIRETVPFLRVRLIREEMPIDVYGEELRNAELGYPDDDDPDFDDPDDPEPESRPTAAPPAPEPPNGQGAS